MEGAGEELAGEGAAGPAAGGAPGAQTAAPRPPPPTINAVPTEVILSGFRSADTQYAAIARFEALAGRICEDYPREPPPGTGRRRYGGVLRESVGFGAYSASPTAARRRNHGPATAEERAKVARVAGGEHWIKVTFESAEAAEAAVYASPQSVLGCLVSAELYHGRPPARDEVVWDEAALLNGGEETTETVPTTPSTPKRRGGATAARRAFGLVDQLSPESSTSGTIETATMSSTTVAGGGGSVVPVGGAPETPGGWAAEPSTAVEPVTPGRSTAIEPQTPGTAARRRPAGARKLALLPAEQALLPQPSMAARVLNRIPFLKWFSGSMIGNEVPRTESGEFDWARASLYWKVVAWLDSVLGLFGGEVVGVDRDD